MGRLSWIIQGAQCNHKGPYKEVAGRLERTEALLLALKMEGGKLSKLERTKKKTDSSQAPLEGMQPCGPILDL